MSLDATGQVRTRRMDEQRWLLDHIIGLVGVDWDQGRTRYTAAACGLDAQSDFARVRQRIRKFADIDREFAAAARRRERLADEAEAAARHVEAREHAMVASVLWGNAEWPLFGDVPLLEEYGQHKLACYERFRRLAPHVIHRVDIPFAPAALPAYLHLPSRGEPPYSCVVQIGGMDSFKEHRVAIYGDRFLERGIACLAVEIPGQGEALARGLKVGPRTAVDAGAAIFDWLATRSELDPGRIGLTGNSFGSFWATQIAATTDALAGCAVTAVIQEPGMRTIFEAASPTFKARFMYMSGHTDEDEFDKFAATLDMSAAAASVTCPYLAIAGEDDELSPLHNTFAVLARIPAPCWLVVYEGERHSIGGGRASELGPNRAHLAAQWLADRFAGQPAADRYTYVDSAGNTSERDPTWRGAWRR